MAKVCKHFWITGKVQGVFYRDSTRKKARELNITGWVRNLGDGRVEVLACGEINNIESLENWLWKGPPNAEVKNVQREENNFEQHLEFVIR